MSNQDNATVELSAKPLKPWITPDVVATRETESQTTFDTDAVSSMGYAYGS